MQNNFYSTAEVADRLKVKPESVRHALCLKGHYMGLRPHKLPNGRWIWAGEEVDGLLPAEPQRAAA